MIIKNLGEITNIQKGTSITKGKIIEGNIPVIAGGQNPAYFCNKCNRNGPIITVSASGAYAGFVNFFDYPIFASDCTTIEPINNSILDISYLFLCLKSKQQEIYRLQRGAGQPHVYGSDLQNLKIPLPPLAEQQAIAHKLDQIQHLISLKQQAIIATDQLAKSIFLEMFGDPMTNEKGWEIKKFNSFGKVRGGATIKSTEFTKNGVPVIRIGTANKGYIDLSNAVYLSDDIAEKYRNYEIYPGDLVLTLTGTVGKEDYGNICVVDSTFEKYILNQRVAKLDIDKSIIKKEFFAFYISSPEIKSQLTGVSRGVRQANISNGDIEKLNIILPPLPLQQQFADIIISLEATKSAHKLALTKLEELYQSEMQRSFNV